MKSVLILITLIGIAFGALAADADRAAIKKILQAPHKDGFAAACRSHAEELKPWGGQSLPLLATLLEDGEVGWDAVETMLVIDAERAAPLIFASMPKSDRNVQWHTFRFFNRLVHQAAAVPYASAMHHGAVRCLEMQTDADAGELALLAVGLTGSEADFPLLERMFENKHPTGVWRLKLQGRLRLRWQGLGIGNIFRTLWPD